jgi:cysteine-rich repeat protein/parallel beta-helix repeat protein
MPKIRFQTIVLAFVALALAVGGNLLLPKSQEVVHASSTWTLDGTASGCTSISTGTTWNSYTKTCTLGSSPAAAAYSIDAIDITASGVTLDCNGYTIAASSVTGYPMGVYGNMLSNIIVKNCTITGFGYGIYINANNGSNIAILNNTLSNNSQDGIMLAYATSSVVINNTATGSQDGLQISGGGGYGIYGNNLNSSSSGGYGLVIGGSASSKIIGNTMNSNGTGFLAMSSSGFSNNTFQGNTLKNNAYYGLYIMSTDTGNTATANIMLSNGTKDLYYYSNTGFTFTNNTCSTIQGSATCAWSTLQTITVCGNYITQNATLSNSITCSANSGVLFNAANVMLDCQGYQINGVSGYYGVANTAANTGAIVKNCLVAGAPTIGIYDNASTPAFMVVGNTVSSTSTNGIYALYPDSNTLIAGNTVNGPTQYGIRAQYTSNSGSQILDNTVLNMPTNYYGLYVGQASQAIKYNTLTNNGFGIYVSGTTSVPGYTISNNIINGSNSKGYGLYTMGQGGTISNNVIINHTTYGFVTPSASYLYAGNTLTNNVITGNATDFYDLAFNSANGTASGNTCNTVYYYLPWADSGQLTSGCTYHSITSTCGNSVLENNEKCDYNGTGCSSCQITPGYTCTFGGTACTATATNYCHLSSCTGLVGDWPLDDSGTVYNKAATYDYSGQRNRASLTTSTSITNSAGKYSNAYTLDGSSSYLEVNDDNSLRFGTGDFTISAWVKTTQSVVSGTYPAIVDKEDGAAVRQGYGLALNGNSSNLPYFFIYSGGSLANVTSAHSVTDGNWHLITAVKTSSQICLYVDNNSAECQSHSLGSTDKASQLRIGRKSGSTYTYYFNGSIDDVLMWNRALASTEAYRLFNSPRSDLPTATTFTTTNGSTDLLSQQNLSAVPNLKLAKSTNEYIQWTNPVNAVSQNYDTNVKVNTNYVTVNKASLDSSVNSVATVKVNIGSCTNWNIYHATSVVTSLAQLRSAGPRVGYGNGASGTCTSYCGSPTCSGGYLSYTVTGFDSTGGETGTCGNGAVEGTEACDDGNTSNGDGCSSTCTIESGYGCAGQPSVCSVGVTKNVTSNIGNTAPTFTAGPSDGGVTTSVNEGAGAVTMTATATDVNLDSYYLAVCKTNSITAHNASAPTCDSGQTLCVSSSATASGVQATCGIDTTGLSETQAWYAFACDNNSGSAACSSSSQGSGATGSPFYVNHRPTYSGFSATDPSGGSIQPGENVKFSVTTADSDTYLGQDTVAMFVCASGNTFNGVACSGTELCHTSQAAPGAATCTTSTSPVPVPSAAGTYNVEVFVVDGHGFAGNQASTQSYGVTNVAPSITAGPSDGGSSATTPTSVGNNVTFTATATDPNGDQYFLAICKTNAITAGNNAAPTCTGGSWAITPSIAPVSSGSQATLTYTALLGDVTSNAWYAFVCDNSSSSLCSAVAQGSGDTGSPFVVNHAPVIGTITAGASYGSNASIDPGNTAYFQVGVTDADSNTVSLYVCSTAVFTGGVCETGKTICSATGVSSGSNAQCSNATLVPIPTASGTNRFYVFLKDSFGLADGGTGGSNLYSVTNVAPTLSSYQSISALSLTAGSSVAPSYTVNITDNNGGSTLTGATAVLYDITATSLTSGTCTANEQNCYPGVACSAGTPSGANLTYTCTWDGTHGGGPVWFNADASSGWKMHVNPTDGTNAPTNLSDSSAFTVNALSGLNVLAVGESSISYGALNLGAVSSDQASTLQNMGNTILDVYVSGTNMTSGSNSIPAGQQKFSSVSDFTYSSAGYALLISASGTGAATGCVNTDMPVRAVHNVGSSSDKPLHWKLQIPSSQASGSYTGSNTFASTASSTCSGSY